MECRTDIKSSTILAYLHNFNLLIHYYKDYSVIMSIFTGKNKKAKQK